jgi:hypothetical protein
VKRALKENAEAEASARRGLMSRSALDARQTASSAFLLAVAGPRQNQNQPTLEPG